MGVGEVKTWTLDSLVDAVVDDMHPEQVASLIREAYDAGRRDAINELCADVRKRANAEFERAKKKRGLDEHGAARCRSFGYGLLASAETFGRSA